MSIYNGIFNLNNNDNPWKICTDLKPKQHSFFQRVLINTLKKEDNNFRKSIDISVIDMNYIATYNLDKTRYTEFEYFNKVEDIVRRSNLDLPDKFNNYKLDIIGNNRTGKIIIMKKK